MKVTSEIKKDFFKKGWILVDMGFSHEELNYFYKGLIKLKENALNSNYPLGRTYFPHLRSDNIAAIEAPFNKRIITKPIKDLFNNLKLGSFIKELMDWEEVYLPLARLFIMSSYNYRGDWHRDYYDWEGTNKELKYIQCAIYLKDQPGFRLFKKKYDICSKNPESINQSPIANIMPLKINPEFYTEIPGKAGSLLLFDPGILHQGNSSSERLDFHLRLSKEKIEFLNNKNKTIEYSNDNNQFMDFKVLNIYSQNANPLIDNISPKLNRISFIRRIINSLNYYTLLINILKFLKLKFFKKDKLPHYPWKFDFFANSYFQKKD